MTTTRRLTPRKALMFFTFALVGSLTGTLVGPRIVGAFDGSPVWLLPVILCVLILLALIVTYMAFHLATKSKRPRHSEQDDAA